MLLELRDTAENVRVVILKRIARRRARRQALLLWSALFALILGVSTTAPAQYFGRNKVQYESFDFQTLETDHFNIYYYPAELEAARDAARMAERWYARLSKIFRHEFRQRKPIIFYANHADFQQTNVIQGLISEGTGGVTEGLKDRVVIPFTGSYSENDHVIGHELVHAFQYDLAKAGPRGVNSLLQAPLWMIEGMAEYLSIGQEGAHTAMWMRDAVLHDDIPTIDDLRKPRYFPYRFGHAVWAFVAGTYGEETIPRLFAPRRRMVETPNGGDRPRGPAEQPQTDTVAIPTVSDTLFVLRRDSLSKAWEEALRRTYGPQIEGRVRPSEAGQRILAEDIDAGDINLSPALSPDGKYVAFLSERDVFSIELFMADATTGEVLKSITKLGTDGHFDALSFMNSAGTWSPEGRRFAFVVYREGGNELVIYNLETERTERQVRIDTIGSIETPAWSPDGRAIVFGGTIGGIQDLYLLNLMDNSVRRLTNDKYFDTQPSWSPDGRFIVFSTDRGEGTDFDNLTFAPPSIGILNVETAEIQLHTPFKNAKHISPHYSPDGRSLFFISDRGGFSDVYRLDLESGNLYQVTKLATGVSGLTALSPALSVARKTGRMIFTVFEDRAYNGYAREAAQTMGEPITGDGDDVSLASILPPVDAFDRITINRYVGDPITGLPSPSTIVPTDFRSAFQLDYIGGAAVGAVTDRFGSAVGGGVNFYFSDILGHNNLGIALQASGTFKDIGGQAVYTNLSRRWNWGAAVSHIPYLTAFTRVGTGTILVGEAERRVLVYEEIRERVFDTRALLLTQYPISTTRRWELSAGVRRIGYDREVEQVIVDRGQIIQRSTSGLEAPPGFNLVQGALAFVGDYSFFGFTSPTSGGRYRFEVESTFGTLDFFAGLADYRRYFFANPFTLAFRAFHFGRYGPDAESDRLAPLFIGYPTLVRGYSESSFDIAECTSSSETNCPEFDRLIGSKIAVANVELRIPLFGSERFGLLNVPFLPLELVGFADVGLAWSNSDQINFVFERNTPDRVPVVSTGASARVNLLGFLITEIYYVFPFQRPQKGWHVGFQIAPGW